MNVMWYWNLENNHFLGGGLVVPYPIFPWTNLLVRFKIVYPPNFNFLGHLEEPFTSCKFIFRESWKFFHPDDHTKSCYILLQWCIDSYYTKSHIGSRLKIWSYGLFRKSESLFLVTSTLESPGHFSTLMIISKVVIFFISDVLTVTMQSLILVHTWKFGAMVFLE